MALDEAFIMTQARLDRFFISHKNTKVDNKDHANRGDHGTVQRIPYYILPEHYPQSQVIRVTLALE